MNGENEEEVYIELPEIFPLSEDKDMVCRFKKALYGLNKNIERSMQGWIITWKILDSLKV